MSQLIGLRRLLKEFVNESIESYLPPGHQLGTRVAKGGSCCANCRWLDKDSVHCKNKFYQRWNADVAGSKTPSKIPAPADEYCCDLWQG